MSFVDKYELIERYLAGKLTGSELVEFENKLHSSESLQKEVEEHRFFMDSLQVYGNRTNIKAQLDIFHQELQEEKPTVFYQKPVFQKLWKKYVPTIAVAASVALITAISILFNVRNFNSLESKQINYYQSLKKDLDKVKAAQKDLVEKNEKAEAEVVSATPIPVNSTATAFVVSSNGYLITNYHVVKDARSMFIESKKLPVQRMPVEVFYKDEQRDLAILKITDSSFVGFPQLPYTFRTEMADLGEDVFTLAYPREDMVYGEGTVSSNTGFEGDTIAYQISIPVNPGNSGSPLLDEKGNLVGVISGKNTKEDGATYAVKARYIKAMLDSLSKTETINLPRYNQIQYLKRPQQIKKLQDFVFELKVYSQTFEK